MNNDNAARWLSAFLPVLAIICARPFVEMGLNDDFSFAKSAWSFAQTGRLHYYGWAEMPLGWLIVWSYPFIRLLGPTYAAVRIADLVLFGLTLLLVYPILRKASLNPVNAAFGTLVMGLTPVLFSLSATFMTDTANLFGTVVCIYCSMRVLEADDAHSRLVWLSVGFVAGMIGGTARQTVWVAAIACLCSVAWARRKEQRSLVLAAIFLSLVTLVIAVLCMRWFNRQPFHQSEPIIAGPLHPSMAHRLLDWGIGSLFCLFAMVWPLGGYARPHGRRSPLFYWSSAVGLGFLILCIVHLATRHLPGHGWAPWIDGVTVFLIHGELAAAVPRWVGPVLTALVTLSAGLFILTLLSQVNAAPRSAPDAVRGTISWSDLLQLLGAFTVCYGGLLGVRALGGPIFDRYLLPLVIVVLIVALRALQERVSQTPGPIAWSMLVVMAYFSLAGLHDWTAEARARLNAVASLRAAGVQDRNIEAGFAFDGLTQINLRGSLVAPGDALPTGFDTTVKKPEGLPSGCDVYPRYFPAVVPKYRLAYSVGPCLNTTSFGEVTYRPWLPFGARNLLILHFVPVESAQTANAEYRTRRSFGQTASRASVN